MRDKSTTNTHTNKLKKQKIQFRIEHYITQTHSHRASAHKFILDYSIVSFHTDLVLYYFCVCLCGEWTELFCCWRFLLFSCDWSEQKLCRPDNFNNHRATQNNRQDMDIIVVNVHCTPTDSIDCHDKTAANNKCNDTDTISNSLVLGVFERAMRRLKND